MPDETVDMPLSPYHLALRPDRDHLPAVLQDLFLLPSDAPYQLTLEGTMTRVWHRPRLITPLLSIAGRLGIAFPETGRDVPIKVTISANRDPRGRPYHDWRRSFFFPHRSRDFNTRTTLERNHPADRLGPSGALELTWQVKFITPLSVEIFGNAWGLHLGPFRLPLPSLLLGSAHALQTAISSTDSSFTVKAEITHPILGPIFGYEGTVHLRREPTSQ